MGVPLYNRTQAARRLYPYQRYLALLEELRKCRHENLLVCRHPPTVTAGIQSHPKHLLRSPENLSESGIEYASVGRGGDHTAHEPGQIVLYPHLDLRVRKIRVGDLVRALLSITSESIREVWNIETGTRADAPGLYSSKTGGKLVSIGLWIRSDFTGSGLALNVENDLSTFSHIVPCGRPDIDMTTIERLGGDAAKSQEFVQAWVSRFNAVIS